MPQGFTTLRNPALTTNSHGQTENCYYCTVAALLGMTTDELVGKTQMMMEDTAKEDQILQLMREAGIAGPTFSTFQTLQSLEQALNTLGTGQAVGVAYRRTNGSGHMIVAARDNQGACRYIDYQNTPPTLSAAFPEPAQNILFAHIFYRA